jgi:alpha-amylase
MEQLNRWGPDALQTFVSLFGSGSVELLGETYYHSLFSLYDREEFIDQVGLHSNSMEKIFGVTPVSFRNTELLYDDRVSDFLSALGQFRLILGEDALTSGRRIGNPCLSYNGLHRLLLRHHRLSDDIAFRFTDRGWNDYPLTAEKFAAWLDELGQMWNLEADREADTVRDRDGVLLIYLDYETLGEHHSPDTGIFRFFENLTEIILKHARLKLCWPSEALLGEKPLSRISVQSPVSWADSGKGIDAWLSEDLQRNAMFTLLRVFDRIKRTGDELLLKIVRRLSSSDHFYYMYPWDGSVDGAVHRRFTPYSSPEDGYIRLLNAITALELRIT